MLFLNSIKAQSIFDVLKNCDTILLNAPFNKKATRLKADTDKYSLPGSYLLPFQVKTLYNLPVQKVLLIAYEDTVRAVSVFVPFDSSLHKRLENDLGPSVGAWTESSSEQKNISNAFYNMRWMLDRYIVVLDYTRNMRLLRESDADDRIIITISRKRK
jgi:hypothetical protein